VLVVGGASAEAVDSARAVAALRALVDAGARARPAAAVVSDLTGMSANSLYREIAASSDPGLR